MGVLRALVLCGFAACYRPGLDSSCLLRCDDVGGEAACPNGLSCNNGFCGRGSDVCNGDGGVVPDAPSDGRDPDGMLGELCVGTAPIQPCFTPPPSGTLDLTGFSTDTCNDVQVLGGKQTCVVAAAFVQVSGTQRFTGARPLVIVGTQQIVIGAGATIDVSSSRTLNPRHGAGAPGVCGTAEQGMGATGGSAGGTFVGQGGSGGNGDGGGIGGSPAPVPSSVGFGGGCDGAQSPNNQAPGPGGGAVYLISEAMIVLSGDIAAGGGGGLGGQESEGGAGGGSGGFIVLDSPMVGFGAGVELVASGGGGGGGGCMGLPGVAGQDATILDATAAGGDGGGNAGDGGIGATSLASANDANGATDPSCAGGGGGGSVGRIRFMRGGTCGGRCTPLAD